MLVEPNVTLTESSGVKGRKIGESILRLRPDLALGDSSGRDCNGPTETSEYSLLLGPRPKKKWGMFRVPREWIGLLSIRGEKANEKRWLLEVFGRSYVHSFHALATDLAREYGVEIHLRLEKEHPKREDFFDSGD